MGLTLRAAAITDVGRARSRNEDAARVDGVRGIAVVADGMGGHPAGNVASVLAAEEVVRRLSQAGTQGPTHAGTPGELAPRMADAVRGADQRVREACRDDPTLAGMGTTLTALWVDKGTGRAAVGHVGDSRVYRLRTGSPAGAMEVLTRDHTWVAEQVEAGRLTPEQARQHPWASRLMQAVGVDPRVRPDVTELEARPGDLFLLCSDGLSGMIADGAIETLLRARVPSGLERAARALVDAANEAGGHDNVTVALLEVGER